MSSGVSTEKPKGALIREIARDLVANRRGGGKTLLVGGPAIVHTGSGPLLCQLIRGGYINKLFAGNALATHDIEQSLFGTSLGVHLADASIAEAGHEHHLRAINRIRRCGSIRQAVEQGVLKSGIMYECVKHNVDFLLAGSIRDDGPLPDVITDVLEAQRQMRADDPRRHVLPDDRHDAPLGRRRQPAAGLGQGRLRRHQSVDRHQAQRPRQLPDVGLVTDVEPFLRALTQEIERAGTQTAGTSVMGYLWPTAAPHPDVPAGFLRHRVRDQSVDEHRRGRPTMPIAVAQWQCAACSTSKRRGAKFRLLEPVDGPARPGVHRQRRDDLRQAGALSHFRHPQRQGEEPHNRRWLAENGFEVVDVRRRTSASKAPATRSSAATRSSPATACGATPPATSKSASCSAAA